MGRQDASCAWKRKLIVNNWKSAKIANLKINIPLKITISMFDHFTKEKSDFLRKKDKSKKGCVDEDIKEIVGLINSKKYYYTTSSCA